MAVFILGVGGTTKPLIEGVIFIKTNDVTVGTIVIGENKTFKHLGIHSGDINLDANSIFILNGILNGDIFVTKNSTYILCGIHNGKIYNHGKVTVHGILNTPFKPTGNIEFSLDAELNIVID